MKNKAFTLMELVVYLGVSSLVIVVLTGTIIQISRVYSRSKIYRTISENGNNAMQKISYEIMDAQNVNLSQSDFINEPNRLALNEVGSGYKRFWIQQEASINKLFFSTEDSSPPNTSFAVTSDNIEVDNLLFSYSPAEGDATASIRITLILSDTSNKYNISETFTTTANLRIY